LPHRDDLHRPLDVRRPTLTTRHWTDPGAVQVSYVGRPRDPLARFSQVEIDKDTVIDLLGRWPDGGTVYCYRCLQKCSGFRRNFEDAPDID